MDKRSLKILVVDDEPDVVEIISYNLIKEKHTVIRADNGKDCITLAGIHKPDLIIMDIRMPGITGIETCRLLKTSDGLKMIPILFLTADSDEYTTMNAMDAGGEHFVTKPVKPSVLMRLIDELQL
jgi:two-component system, OmpR family, alkaline phosphatase synthesis response regulator PhoP